MDTCPKRRADVGKSHRDVDVEEMPAGWVGTGQLGQRVMDMKAEDQEGGQGGAGHWEGRGEMAG